MNLVGERLTVWARVAALSDVRIDAAEYGQVELELGIRNDAGV